MSGIELLELAGLALYLMLAAAAIRLWRAQRTAAAAWVTAAFTMLAAVALGAQLTPDEPPLVVTKLLLVGITALPYLMVRFADSLAALARFTRRLADLAFGVLVVLMLVLNLASGDGQQPTWYWPFVIVFLTYWGGCFGLVGWRLARAGRSEPTLARRRMRVLALGSVLMGLVLMVSVFGDDSSTGAEVATQLLAVGSGGLFLLGFAPPAALRTAWRQPEEQELHQAALQLMAAATQLEAAQTLAPHLARVVGADAVIIEGADGDELAHVGSIPEEAGTRERMELRTGAVVLHSSPYAPFFGVEERRLVRRLGLLADLAMTRVTLLEQLSEANVALAEANDELESFVYTASHDLKNPLIAMLGYLDVLRADYGSELDEQGRWYVERMVTNGTFMEALIQDLLELSRVGRVSIEPAQVPLGALVDDVTADLRERYPDLQVHREDTLPTLWLNPARARQLLTNLLENAAKYATDDRVQVTVSTTVEDDDVLVHVVDDGEGVPEAYAERVFGVFERLHADDSRTQGTGIGLAICRKIVEQAGGRIRLVPKEQGHGAHFELRFPSSSLIPGAGPQPVSGASQTPSTILEANV